MLIVGVKPLGVLLAVVVPDFFGVLHNLDPMVLTELTTFEAFFLMLLIALETMLLPALQVLDPTFLT